MNTCPTCQNDLVCHDQGECLRPTPETDEAQFGTGRVSVDFARRLERERNEAREENARLREALDTLTCVIGLTPIAGNKEALQEAFDNARKLITP